jgi:hypothetical protein
MSQSNSTRGSRRSAVLHGLLGLLAATNTTMLIAAQSELLPKQPGVENPGAAGDTASLPVPAVSCRRRLFPTMSC